MRVARSLIPRGRFPLAVSNDGRKPWFRLDNPPRFTREFAGFSDATAATVSCCLGSASRRRGAGNLPTNGKENEMNKDQAAGGWKELKGKIKQQWGKLTDDDLTVLEGSAQELSGRIQKRYGIAQEEAEKQVDTFRRANNDLISRW
jgi:uncharacterized protein YjbJ (UPF0337 family)